jgi:hypothetical protein
MSLFQYLNNEALDEDQKQKARLAHMIQKNYKENTMAINTLTTGQDITLNKAIYQLNEEIDSQLYGEQPKGGMINIGRIPLFYNNLSTLLKNYKVNTIEPIQRGKIYKTLDDLLPKLDTVYKEALKYKTPDAFQLKLIIDGIKSKLFSPVIDTPTKKQLKDLITDRKEYNLETEPQDDDEEDENNNEFFEEYADAED